MFACIYIPDFPVEAIVRNESLLRERPVAILDGKPPLTRVIATNEKARSLGMETGMTKLEAAVFADARVEKASNENALQTSAARLDLAVLRQRAPEQENSAHAALLDIAHTFTPRVEDTACDTLLLDLTGLERLYGTPASMSSELMLRIRSIGIEANVALAANPDSAMHAAFGFNGSTIIPAGQERQRLSALPIQVLLETFEICSKRKTLGKASERKSRQFREQMLDTLERWGVRDFRTLGQLPDHALASRLGEPGVQLRQLACGEGKRTLVLCAPPSRFEEAMELESPVETIESLSFVLNRLLEQLCARLEARALATHELHLRLQLETRVAEEDTTTSAELHNPRNSHNVGSTGIFARTLRLPVSMRDSKVFLKLLQLELAGHSPGAPVSKIWITAEPAPPRSAQGGLFLPATPEAERLEITLARLSAVVGERRAGIARLLDTHRRGRFRMDCFIPPALFKPPDENPTTGDNDSPPLALRILRPPRRLHVRLAAGRPCTLSADARHQDEIHRQEKVLWAAGPWRSSGDWWTENTNKDDPDAARVEGPWDREEWDIAIAGSGRNGMNGQRGSIALYRIYHDLGKGGWFLDASYD